MSALTDRVGALVGAVDRLWRADRHALEPFPDLAARALTEVAPLAGLDAADIAEAVAGDPGLGAGVGEAPEDSLPLYEGPRFSVALQVLIEGHEPPRDHGWAGAYQALASGGWCAAYAFDAAVIHDPSFALGALRRVALHPIAPGEALPVAPAPRLVRAVIRVERPALALIVKTSEPLGVLPSTYLAPGARIASAPPPPNTIHRLRALDALRTVDRPSWLERLRRSLADSDPRTSFYLLRYAHERVGASGLAEARDAGAEWDALDGLVGIAERAFGAHTDTVRRALARVARQPALDRRLAAADSDDERLACAALHLGEDAADADAILAAIRDRAPGGARGR